MTLRLLSGGAAQALVGALAAEFRHRHGLEIEGEFGAVGAMRAKLEAGHPADLVILTSAILADLAEKGLVLGDSIRDIGDVATAVAIRQGDSAPEVGDEASLRGALLAADAIYFPDPALATAGIHFAKVLDRLGIAEEVARRLKTFPNGATAMAALAKAPERRPIGCTQVTEIKATAGAALVAELPRGFDLTTRYTAGVVARSAKPDDAMALIALLTGPDAAAERRRCGFD